MASRFDPTESLLPIEVQLQGEKASALRRVGESLEQRLAELAEMERELRTLGGAARERCLARHRGLRSEAQHLRWCLIVQREAMGLYRHGDVYELYPIPPAWESMG